MSLKRLTGAASGGGNDFEHVVAPITSGVQKAIRVVDDLEKTVIAGQSWIICKIKGEDKPMPFNVYKKYDDGKQLVTEQSALGRLISFVSEKVPVVGTDGKKKWMPKYKEQFPDVYDFMFPEGQDAKKWNPSPVIYMNVIDRSDNWCVMNRHTKILSKSDTAKGVGGKMFQAISDLVTTNGDARGFDIVVSKSGQNMNTKYAATVSLIQNPSLGNVIGEMTPDEQQYAIYDIDFLTKLTPARTVLDRLGDAIQWIDSQLKTNYYNELVQEASADGQETQTSSPSVQTTPQSQTQSYTPPVTNSGSGATNASKFNDVRSRMSGNTPPPAPVTPPASRFKLATPPPVSVPEVEKDNCPHCGELIPITSTSCPKCGAIFNN